MSDGFTHPGVYVQEVLGAGNPIPAATTATTAFVGRAPRGCTGRALTITSLHDFERRFGGLWEHGTLGFAVRDFFVNGGSTALVVRLFGGTEDDHTARISKGAMTLRAADPGSWGNSLRVRVDHLTHDADVGHFTLSVRDGTTGVIEEHHGVTTDDPDHPRYLGTVLDTESELIRLVTPVAGDAEIRPPQDSNEVPPDGTVWDQDTTSTPVAPSDRVTDGEPLTLDDFIGTGQEAANGGLYALDQEEVFNLLVLPPYTDTGDVDASLVSSAHAFCERRQAVLIVDGRSSWTDANDVTQATISNEVGALGRNSALYFPRLQQPNPLRGNQIETFSAAGAVAGVMARTDVTDGVWKAPAGSHARLVGVAALSVPLGNAEIARLTPLGVNCLRVLPGAGPAVWGARTSEGVQGRVSEWTYVPVRRTALFVQQSVHRGTRWATFETNDESLWARIRSDVSTFLHGLFRQGAFRGSTPREAFFVRCDAGTTTQADIDRGIVTIVVGFAPLKPAEFVVLEIEQIVARPPA